MCEDIRYFGQREYNRVLDNHGARELSFGHAECAHLLIEHGASEEQAKNGAYVYLHHGGKVAADRRGTREEYFRLLDQIDATHRAPRDCVRYLEELGYSYGQAKTAVYNYRSSRGLIGRRS